MSPWCVPAEFVCCIPLLPFSCFAAMCCVVFLFCLSRIDTDHEHISNQQIHSFVMWFVCFCLFTFNFVIFFFLAHCSCDYVLLFIWIRLFYILNTFSALEKWASRYCYCSCWCVLSLLLPLLFRVMYLLEPVKFPFTVMQQKKKITNAKKIGTFISTFLTRLLFFPYPLPMWLFVSP